MGLALLALMGGASLGINRAFLGRLGTGIGPVGASVINHLGGAIFVFVIILMVGGRFDLGLFNEAPLHAYLGGAIGALFVALTSWLIPRAGVAKTSILLISGQMLLSTLIDFIRGQINSIPVSLLGLVLIISGVLVGEYRKNRS